MTSRAKAPDKLRQKLQKKYQAEPDVNTVDQALDKVSDRAGVRISTYLEVDRDRVVDEIKRLFDGPGSAPVPIDKKDAADKYYRATHCQVALKPEDLADQNANLEGLTCEIQVCSLLAHVWNELEHDLIYKPTTGELSVREKESLKILGNLTLTGDGVIKQLFDSNAERIKQALDRATPFQDVYDFVARVRDDFPNCDDFGANAGQLYENLVELGINTPTKVRESIVSHDHIARSTALLEKVRDYLSSHHDDAVIVEPRSSDALLVLVLDSQLDQVLSLNPMGRGKGRPPRIASFANRFKAMKQEAAAALPAAPTPTPDTPPNS